MPKQCTRCTTTKAKRPAVLCSACTPGCLDKVPTCRCPAPTGIPEWCSHNVVPLIATGVHICRRHVRLRPNRRCRAHLWSSAPRQGAACPRSTGCACRMVYMSARVASSVAFRQTINTKQQPPETDDSPGLPTSSCQLLATPQALDVGRDLLQSFAPLKAVHEHVCAWHFYAHDMGRQVEVHHYCRWGGPACPRRKPSACAGAGRLRMHNTYRRSRLWPVGWSLRMAGYKGSNACSTGSNLRPTS